MLHESWKRLVQKLWCRLAGWRSGTVHDINDVNKQSLTFRHALALFKSSADWMGSNFIMETSCFLKNIVTLYTNFQKTHFPELIQKLQSHLYLVQRFQRRFNRVTEDILLLKNIDLLFYSAQLATFNVSARNVEDFILVYFDILVHYIECYNYKLCH